MVKSIGDMIEKSPMRMGLWGLLHFLVGIFFLMAEMLWGQLEVEWVLQSEGKSNEYINSMAVDRLGNVYITGGFFRYSLIFQDFELTSGDVSIAAYWVKISPNGRVKYARSIYSRNARPEYTYVGVDRSANLYIGTTIVQGQYLLFGEDTIGRKDIFQKRDLPLFVKYDSSGRLLYYRVAEIDTFTVNYLSDLVVDTLNDCLYTLFYSRAQKIRFGDLEIRGVDDSLITGAYLVKWSLDGKALWYYGLYSRGWKGQNFFGPHSMAYDGEENIYLVGTIDNYGSDKRIYLEDTVLEYEVMPGDKHNSGFILKLDGKGQFQWFRVFVIEPKYEGLALHGSYYTRMDRKGNIVLNGRFTGRYMLVGDDTLYNPHESPGHFCSYLMKMSSEGEMLWGKTLPLAGLGDIIALDAEDKIYLHSSFDLDTLVLEGDTVYRVSQNGNLLNNDLVLLRFSEDGKLEYSYSYGGAESEQAAHIHSIGDGELILCGRFCSEEMELSGYVLRNPYCNDWEYLNPTNIFVSRVKLLEWVDATVSPNGRGKMYGVYHSGRKENRGEYIFEPPYVLVQGMYVVVAYYGAGDMESMIVIVGE